MMNWLVYGQCTMLQYFWTYAVRDLGFVGIERDERIVNLRFSYKYIVESRCRLESGWNLYGCG